jgi:ectoine hydroxylase-related dioxygenase (phytanoyl-CoA dioxygenase family)
MTALEATQPYADLLPTDEDVAFYAEHGYWISGPILPDAVIDAAERGMERLYVLDTDRVLPDGKLRYGWTHDDGDVLRKNDYSSLVVDELAALVRQPVIAACAARLSGADTIRLWHDQLLYKPSDSTRSANVGWHTDRQYWRTCSSESMLTAWVPFHHVGTEHGVVSFVDGSHRWPEDIVGDFFNPDLSRLDALRASRQVEIAAHDIPRGGMSFHHCRTIHGSGPNLSGAPRRALAIHLQPGDNEFVLRHDADGNLVGHANDGLCRSTAAGLPDYSDSVVCPQLWPPVANAS